MLAVATGILRIALVVVIGALLFTIGYLAALVIIQRKKPAAPPPRTQHRVQVAPPASVVTRLVRRPAGGGGLSVMSSGAEAGMTGAGEATRGRKQAAPTGVIAKICPRCGGRYDLATAFCGKDGSELVTIN